MSKREKLLEVRRQLQIKLKAEDYIQRTLQASLEVLNYFKKQEMAYFLPSYLFIPEAYTSYVQARLSQTPFTDLQANSFNINPPDLEAIVKSVLDHFPSKNNFHYVPDLMKYAAYRSGNQDAMLRDGLEQAIQALALPNQAVYVYWMQYGLLLQVELEIVQAHDQEDLFNTWNGDVLIFSTAADWLISFNMEDIWYGGRL